MMNSNFEDLICKTENTTIPLEHTFYSKNSDSYGILENIRYQSGCCKHVENLENRSHIKISRQSGIISKIILDDFPVAECTLVINGHDSGLSTIINGIQQFDFSTPPPILSIWLDMSKRNRDLPNTEEFNLNKENFLNLSAIDSLAIMIPAGVKLNKKHTIKLCGYFLDKNGQWYQDESTYDYYYYDTYRIHMNNPTDSLTFLTNNNAGELVIRLNGEDCYKYEIKDKKFRIKFNDLMLKHQGLANEYLSEYINKNTLNFSKINIMEIIMFDNTIENIFQHYYEIHNFPEREQIYT